MNNISIDGLGNFAGGEYGSVHIDGIASCPDAITCETISVDGTFNCGGNLSAKKASVDGSMNVCGAMTADQLSVDGTLAVESDLHTQRLSVDGSLSVGGTLQTEQLSVDGSTSVHGDLHTPRLSVDGSLSVDGTLHTPNLSVDGSLSANVLISENANVDGSLACASFSGKKLFCEGTAHISEELYAGEVYVEGSLHVTKKAEADKIHADGSIYTEGQISADLIRISGSVRADEIVGDSIHIEMDPCVPLVQRIKKLFGMTFEPDTRDTELCANLIEATSIELTGVCAGVVSGENVTIGENCRIDRLDCTGTYIIDPSSTVRIVNGEPYTPNALQNI